MPRRSKDAPIDLTTGHDITAGLIAALRCPADKDQAFLRDTKAPGLRVRVTKAGAKSFVFESKVAGRTLRRTIGSTQAWSVDRARTEANRLRVLVDLKKDPRDLDREEAARKAQEAADEEARRVGEAARAVTVAQAWSRYLAEGKPVRKAAWKPRYRADLEAAAAAGGEPRKRGKGVTKPGHLAPLMRLKLVDINPDTMREWLVVESKRSPRQAARSAAMFSGFLRWCSVQREYRALVDAKASSSATLGDLLPGKRSRTDALELDQLAPWFAGTDKLRSRTARAYLQALVLTGARREEMAALRWDDIDFRWKKLVLADKVGDRRTIPLTPYVAALLEALPRHNEWVFASVKKAKTRKGEQPRWVSASASGRIAEPRAPHADVLADAGIPHVSIHGLRRTFALLGEAAGAPAGAIAQVMGHRPSAVAEGYKPRSIDALRPYLAQVERFILDKAGVAFDGDAPRREGMRVVKG